MKGRPVSMPIFLGLRSCALFAQAGWRRSTTYPVGGGYSAMELTAV
ncbi:hypothetical protein ACFFHJ_05215 [Planotetraspora thailandica]|nr:hypothetical protein [Planotetraspora thailandica]